MSNNSGPSSGQQQGSQQPQQPPRRHPQLTPSYFPSIYILRPPEGKFSPKVDERCFTYCSQSISGRIHQRPAWCRTVCIRRVFPYEVNRILRMHYSPDNRTSKPEYGEPYRYPLPPEGQRSWSLFDGELEDEEDEELGEKRAGKEKETKYWTEGWYFWYTKSHYATTEKLTLMVYNLERQTEWYRRKNVPAPPHDNAPATPVNMQGPLPYPFNYDLSQDSFLTPLSLTTAPLQKQMGNLLAPTGRVLRVLHSSVESGDQRELARRVWEKARSKEPWVLARNVCQRIWERWKGGPPSDGEAPPEI